MTKDLGYMTKDNSIRFAFNTHGLGDVVHAFHALRLYIAAGYDVAIQVEPNKRWVWEAAGIPIYDGPDTLPLHPYYYEGDTAWDAIDERDVERGWSDRRDSAVRKPRRAVALSRA